MNRSLRIAYYVVLVALFFTLMYSDVHLAGSRPHVPWPGYPIAISVKPFGFGPPQTIYISGTDELKRLGLSVAFLGLFGFGAFREWKSRR